MATRDGFSTHPLPYKLDVSIRHRHNNAGTESSADTTLAKTVALKGRRETDVHFSSVVIGNRVNKRYGYCLFSCTNVEIDPDMRRSAEVVVKFPRVQTATGESYRLRSSEVVRIKLSTVSSLASVVKL